MVESDPCQEHVVSTTAKMLQLGDRLIMTRNHSFETKILSHKHQYTPN